MVVIVFLNVILLINGWINCIIMSKNMVNLKVKCIKLMIMIGDLIP